MNTRVYAHAILLSAATALAAVGPRSAEATTMVPLTNVQLVDAADIVVRGKVVEVWTEQSDNGTIWSRVQVDVERTLKGERRSTWLIDQMGGAWGESSTIVHGGARFSPGEQIILFAEQLGNGRMVPVGMQQGKFTLRLDPYSREMVALRFSPHPNQHYDHRFIPLPSKDARVFSVDLEDEIEQRVRSGWDGQAIPGTSSERLRRINIAQATEVK
jgi:hypothetical protein